jgi:LemA protein
MDHADLVVVAIAAALALFLLWMLGAYNKLVRLRNRADALWADIDVQLKRRHDLVANLVEVVKGYASHERTTFDEVTEARSEAASAATPEDKTRAENTLTGALGRLLATAEAYPELKAEDRFQDLHQELVRLEDAIAFARQAYNLTVQAYNNSVQTMPTAIVAWLMSFDTREYLSAPAAETDVPAVQLSPA